MKLDRIGTFRFSKVLEAGVGQGKTDDNGKPKSISFTTRLLLSEFYDETEGEWVDWSKYEMEATAYFTLFYVDQKTNKMIKNFTHQQIMDVFGWDGRSFQALANDDYSAVKGQVRIVDNDPEYADKNPFQVAAINPFDADPGSFLRKLDPVGLKKLDAEFAQLLQSSGKAPVAATVPAKKNTRPKPPTTTATPVEEALLEELSDIDDGPEPPPTAAQKKTALKAKSDKNKSKKKSPAPPARQASEPEATVATESTKEYTKQQAWEFVVELKNDDCSDEQLSAEWGAAITEIAGADTPDENVTGQEWGKIVDRVLDEVGKL